MAHRLAALVLVLGRGLALAEIDPADTTPTPVDRVRLEDLPAFNVRSIADQLKLIPRMGMEIPPCTIVAGDLFCIDETNPAGGVLDFPGTLIEKVEILRGYGGTLYGSTPLAGVLDIATASDSNQWCSYGNGAAVPIGGPFDPEDDDGGQSPLTQAMYEYLRQLVEASKHGACANGDETAREAADGQAPNVAGSPAQRYALQRQWDDLGLRQYLMEQTRTGLEGQLEKAKDDENQAEIDRIEKALADLTLSQDAVTDAANAVGEQLIALEQDESAKKDDLRAELWEKIHKAANPKIEQRIATAESIQSAKETITTGTQYLSAGSKMQQETARSTRMGNREKIAAEEKIAAADALLADPATTPDARVLLTQMRGALVQQLAAADELLSSNGWITSAGYGVDVGTTVCGAKLAQIGKNAVARIFGGAAARNTSEQVVAQTVAREAGESGSTTGITQVMQRPPIDPQALGDSAVRKAMDGVKKLADEKHGGEFWPAFQQTIDDIVGKDILPLPKTAGSEAAREGLETGWKAARAAAQNSGARAAEEGGVKGGTTVLKDVWKGFENTAADPNGLTTIFSVAPFVFFWGWTQQGYAQEPVFGEKGPDGIFTFPGADGGLPPDTPITIDLFPDAPLDAIVTTPPVNPNLGGPIRQASLDGKTFFFMPGTDLRKHFGNAGSTTNLCRDKKLVPPIDWSDPDAALPSSPRAGAIPSGHLRLR